MSARKRWTFRRSNPARFLLGISVLPVFIWDELDGWYFEIGFGWWALKLWVSPREGTQTNE